MTITQATAAAIWGCHHDIEAGKKLLAELEKSLEDSLALPSPWNPHDRRRRMSFGIPCGEHSTQMIDVAPYLAISIIKAAIAEDERRLVELSQCAAIELAAK